ncbi:DUF2339 domain-containing protein [Duganella callida]|uniref:DUF2339 domain-containing protein n=2 Tax=Duganella callida TaxID=2561932 RepID=A0A4Y9SWG4_9BURK|nr:DUF2339 domain-containing protein [Duganella callida]
MEFLLFVFGVFTLSVAWRARSDARQAWRVVEGLKREVALLREHLLLAPRPAAAPAPPAVAPEVQPAPAADAQSPAPATPDYMRDYEQWAPPPLPVLKATAQPTPATAAQATEAEATVASLAPALEEAAAPQHAAAPRATVPEDTATPWATVSNAAVAPAPTPSAPPAPPPRWLLAAKAWLFGGNLVAKLGLLILFIGVSFLLKYTAARVSIPIELRLTGIVLADIALLAWGWRIRITRAAISLPVQGAALAVLMLVTFGAFRLYHLIPGSAAFALLFILTMFTCVLAVLQDAMWLAIFGIVGGFAAPILASTGGGSHIGLFSYYALLNGGVFALAMLRSWRPLNLLGFAFTFAIGTTWGVLRYTPENYLSVQLFLLLFFAFYVSIPLAYARRQAVKLKNYVDGTLILGTPMLGFGLQFTLVREMPFGAAYSALALGLFYIALTTVLRKRAQYALLADAFLALGIVFGTLAIPFALDGRWTSAAWALEGAGIVWIGLRQQQKLAWMFGLLVQAGAWISFIGASTGLSPQSAMDSNLWLGFLLLAITAFLMATRFRAQPETAPFAAIAAVFLTVAAAWFVAGAWTEIFLRLPGPSQGTPLVFSALIAAIALYVIARRLAWTLAAALALAVQGIAGLLLLTQVADSWSNGNSRLFDRPLLGSLMIFGAAIFSSWALYRQQAARGSRTHAVYRLLLVWSAIWWFVLATPDLATWLAPKLSSIASADNSELAFCLYALLLAATTWLGVSAAHRLQWPALRWFAAPVWVALAVAHLPLLTLIYIDTLRLPSWAIWSGYAALWLAGEWLLRAWRTRNWNMRGRILRTLHAVRTGGPWLLIWPVAAYWISAWVGAGPADWGTSGSWARFIPSWLMMAVIAWLMQRSRGGGWPVAPLAEWYRRRLLPVATGWAVLLVFVWNVTQDGAMAPLPYIPLLNPLDLSTCFVILLMFALWRLHPERPHGWPQRWFAPQPLFIAAYGYIWFNLALMRTVSHYLAVPYTFDALYASQFVQAMLSLVWSVTALLLMRHAARRALRPVWIGGAALLALVVLKLFLVDLSNVGGVERIVSFLGVGALMVGIGYLAPFPTQSEHQ